MSNRQSAISLRFIHAGDIRIWWGHDGRAEKFYIADTAASALEIRERAGHRGKVMQTSAAEWLDHRPTFAGP
jgi:hypothetical protein